MENNIESLDEILNKLKYYIVKKEIKNFINITEDILSKYLLWNNMDDIVELILNTCINYLESNDIIYDENNPYYTIRKKIFDLISIFPLYSLNNKQIEYILYYLLKNIKIECEENSLICIKIILEYMRSSRPEYGDDINIFIRELPEFYNGIKNAEEKRISEIDEASIDILKEVSLNVDGNINEILMMNKYKKCNDGKSSIKVLTEIHVFLVLVYQLYRQKINIEFENILPYMIYILSKKQEEVVKYNNMVYNIEEKDEIKKKYYNLSLVNLQLKVMSLIIYMKRSLKNEDDKNRIFDKFHNNIMEGIVELFRNYTLYTPDIKRELLFCTRHMLPYDYDGIFKAHYDYIINVMGYNQFPYIEYVHSQIIVLMTDIFCHHGLQLSQMTIERCIYFILYSIGTNYITINTFKMGLKMINSMLESKVTSDVQKRDICHRVFNVFIDKLHYIKFNIIQYSQHLYHFSHKIGIYNNDNDVFNFNEMLIYTSSSSDTIDKNPFTHVCNENEQNKNCVETKEESDDNDDIREKLESKFIKYFNESKEIIKLILNFSKILTNLILNMQYEITNNKELNSDEIRSIRTIFNKIIKVLKCFRDSYWYKVKNNKKNIEEEKEIGGYVGSLLSNLSLSNIVELFINEFQSLLDYCKDCSYLIYIPEIFMNYNNTSSICATMFFNYFKNHISLWNSFDSTIYSRILKNILSSSGQLKDNEVIIKRWVSFILENSLNQMLRSGHSLTNLLLLRALFRAIGSSNIDELYGEFLPHLRTILTAFNRYRCALEQGIILEMIIELSLSVPVRLSNLVPYMPMIMAPIITSLVTSSALNSQGHRTLDLCLDTLHIMFLDNTLSDIRTDILIELCRRISQNVESSLYSIRLIGKMSGSSVKPYELYQTLPYCKSDKCKCEISIKQSSCINSINIPFNIILTACVSLLKQCAIIFSTCSYDDITKCILLSSGKNAYNIIKTYIYITLPKQDISNYITNLKEFCKKNKNNINRNSDKVFYNKKKSCLKKGLIALMCALRIPVFHDEALSLLIYSYRVLSFYGIHKPIRYKFKKLINNELIEESIECLDVNNFVSPLFYYMSFTWIGTQNYIKFLIVVIINTVNTFIGDSSEFINTSVYYSFLRYIKKFANNIYYVNKCTSIVVMKQIFILMDKSIIMNVFETFITILFDILSSLFSEISSGTNELAVNTISYFIKYIYDDDNNVHSINQIISDNYKMNLVSLLVQKLHANSDMVRNVAKDSLNYLSNKWSIVVKELVHLQHDYIQNHVKEIMKIGLSNLPLTYQLAQIDALTYYCNIKYWDWNMSNELHENISNCILMYCENDTKDFIKSSSKSTTKNYNEMNVLREASFLLLSTMIDISNQFRIKILSSCCKAILNSKGKILEMAKNILLKFGKNIPTEGGRETVSIVIRPLLVKLAQFQERHETNQQMRILVEVFPDMFNEKLCDQFLYCLRESIQDYTMRLSNNDLTLKPISHFIHDELELWITIIDIFHLMPTANSQFIIQLIQNICDAYVGFGINLHKKLLYSLCNFIEKHSSFTITYFIQNLKKSTNLQNLFISLLKLPNNKIINQVSPLLLLCALNNDNNETSLLSSNTNNDINCIDITYIDKELLAKILEILWLIKKNNKDLLLIYPDILYFIYKLWVYYNSNNTIVLYKDNICLFICKIIYNHLLDYLSIDIFINFQNIFNYLPFRQYVYERILPKMISNYNIHDSLLFVHECINKIKLQHNTNFSLQLYTLYMIKMLILLLCSKLKQLHGTDNVSQDPAVIAHLNKVVIDTRILEGIESIYNILHELHKSNNNDELVKGIILKFACYILEYVKEFYDNKYNRLLELLQFVSNDIEYSEHYEYNNRACVFTIISIIYERYDVVGVLDDDKIYKLVVNILKTYNHEIKKEVKKSLSRIVGKLRTKPFGYDQLIEITKNILIEDNNVGYITCHILNVIKEYKNIYSVYKSQLYLPIINIVTKSIINNTYIEEKKIIFELIYILVEWNDVIIISIIYTLLLYNYCTFNEHLFIYYQHKEENILKSFEIIKYCVDKSLYSDEINLNFSLYENTNTNTTSNIGGNSEKGNMYNFHTSIKYSINLIMYIVKNATNMKFIIQILERYYKDIWNIFITVDNMDIKNEFIELYNTIFTKISNQYICINDIYNNIQVYVDSALQNNDIKLVNVILLKLLKNIIKISYDGYYKKYINQLINLLIDNETFIVSNKDEEILYEYIQVISLILDILVLYLDDISSADIFIKLYKSLTNYIKSIHHKTFIDSLSTFIVLSINILSKYKTDDEFLYEYVILLYNTMYIITLSYQYDENINVQIFTSIYQLFRNNSIIFPSCAQIYINTIYHCGINSFLPQVRDLYYNNKIFDEDDTFINKFKCLLEYTAKTKNVYTYHSFVKFWLKYIISPTNNNEKLSISKCTNVLPEFSIFNKFSASTDKLDSDSSILICDQNIVKIEEFIKNNIINDYFTTANYNIEGSDGCELFPNINYGYNTFSSIDNTQSFFYHNLVELSFLDGSLADNLFRIIFQSLWNSNDITLKECGKISNSIEEFLLNYTNLCYNDRIFLCDIVSISKENMINYCNQNIFLTGFYYPFQQHINSLERSKILRYSSLCRLNSLPVSSLNTFLSTIIQFKDPYVTIYPSIMTYISNKHQCRYEVGIYFEQIFQQFNPEYFHLLSSSYVDTFHMKVNHKYQLSNINVFLSLESIYDSLKEYDYKLSLWSICALFGQTITGLGLISHGFYHRASHYFEELIDNHSNSTDVDDDMNEKFSLLYTYENRLWVESWILCMQELGEWGRLYQFCKNQIPSSDDSNGIKYIPPGYILKATLSSSYKLLDFKLLQECINILSSEKEYYQEDSCLINYYNCIYTLFSKDVDVLSTSSVTKTKPIDYVSDEISRGLYDISCNIFKLPSIITPLHITLFRNIHLFTELTEFIKVFYSHSHHSLSEFVCTNILQSNPASFEFILNDLRTLQKHWRIHYPEKNDILSHWCEVVFIRNLSLCRTLNYLNNITYQLISSQPSIPLSRFAVEYFPIAQQHYDITTNSILGHIFASNLMTPYIRYCSIARQQYNYSAVLKCVDVVKPSLSSLQYLSMNFPLLIQQFKTWILLYHMYKDTSYLSLSLNSINDYIKKQMTKENQAFLLLYRGRIQHLLSQYDESNVSYYESLQKFNNTSAWSSWAKLLYNIFVSNTTQVNIGVSSIIAYLSASKSANDLYKTHKYFASALCILQYSQKYLYQLPKNTDNDNNSVENDDNSIELIHTFCEYGIEIDADILLKFIPQLYQYLNNSIYGDQFIKFFTIIGELYSQPIYAYLRNKSSYINTITIYDSLNSTNINQQNINSNVIQSDIYLLIKRIKKIMSTIYNNDTSILYYYEQFIDSLNVFHEKPIHSLYRQIRQLVKYSIQQSHLQIFHQHDIYDHAQIFESVNKIQQQIRHYIPTIIELKDYNTIDECVEYLYQISHIVYKYINETNVSYNLTHTSNVFYNLIYNDILLDLPGEYRFSKINTNELSSSRIVKFYPISYITSDNVAIYPYITLQCVNGKNVSYIITTTNQSASFNDDFFQQETILDFFHSINILLNNKFDSSRKSLYLYLPRHITYSSNLRLIQYDTSWTTLEQIHFEYLYENTTLSEYDIYLFYINIWRNRYQISSTTHQQQEEFSDEQIEYIFPSDLLSNWIYRKYNNSSILYFTVRKQFTKRLAIISLLQHILKLSPLNPNMIQFITPLGTPHFINLNMDLLLYTPQYYESLFQQNELEYYNNLLLLLVYMVFMYILYLLRLFLSMFHLHIFYLYYNYFFNNIFLLCLVNPFNISIKIIIILYNLLLIFQTKFIILQKIFLILKMGYRLLMSKLFILVLMFINYYLSQYNLIHCCKIAIILYITCSIILYFFTNVYIYDRYGILAFKHGVRT